MRIGEAIVNLLHSYGVDTVFGIPGTHSIELYRGLENSPVEHILARHEQGAGFMADGYARVTGRPGVCFVITGPGVSNILTPMAEAMSDCVPMLVISPVNDTDGSGINYGRLHEIGDQAAVTEPLTAFTATATNITDIPEFIARAFNQFYTGRPGPVHLNIPLRLLRSTTEVNWQPVKLDSPVQPDDGLLDAARSLIANANRPVIIAGGGCRHYGELIVALAEKCAIPVMTTVAGRGVIAGTHPLCPGAQTDAQSSRQLLADSDVVIVLGSELSEPDRWNGDLPLPSQQLWVNLDPVMLEARGKGIRVCADARLLVPELTRTLERADPEQIRAAYSRVKKARDQHGAGFGALQNKHWRVWTELMKNLPADVCVFSDMTQLAYTAVEHLPLERSNSWMHPNGYGTLGYALPAAIGARIGLRDLPVFVVVGDAGFQYTIAEIAIAAERQLNVVVLLWQNNALQQIRDDMAEAGISQVAVTQPDPDFVELVRVYGWEASRVQGLFELGSAVTKAFASDGPVLIELCESDV